MIYTAGYYGHTGEQLQERQEALNALVVDIRTVPWSQYPVDFRQEALKTRFGPTRYVTLGHYWGNVNYKNGEPIQIAGPGGHGRDFVRIGRSRIYDRKPNRNRTDRVLRRPRHKH